MSKSSAAIARLINLRAVELKKIQRYLRWLELAAVFRHSLSINKPMPEAVLIGQEKVPRQIWRMYTQKPQLVWPTLFANFVQPLMKKHCSKIWVMFTTVSGVEMTDERNWRKKFSKTVLDSYSQQICRFKGLSKPDSEGRFSSFQSSSSLALETCLTFHELSTQDSGFKFATVVHAPVSPASVFRINESCSALANSRPIFVGLFRLQSFTVGLAFSGALCNVDRVSELQTREVCMWIEGGRNIIGWASANSLKVLLPASRISSFRKKISIEGQNSRSWSRSTGHRKALLSPRILGTRMYCWIDGRSYLKIH